MPPLVLFARSLQDANGYQSLINECISDFELVQWEKRWPPGCHYSMTEIVFSRYLPSSAISYQLEAATLCWYHL